MNIQHLWHLILFFFNSRTCRLCRTIMTSSSKYSLSTVLYLCLKPLRIFQASMYANSLFELPTSCFMRKSFTFCSMVRAFQGLNHQRVLLTRLHVSRGLATLLHPLSSQHPSVHKFSNPSPSQACFLARLFMLSSICLRNEIMYSSFINMLYKFA